MKKLSVELKEIKCVHPEDPVRDELYFLTAVESGSNSSDTIRRIKRGKTLNHFSDGQKKLFEGDVDKDSPIIISVMEQRAIKDDGALQEHMVKYAHLGLDIVKNKAQHKLTNKTELYNYLLKFIKNNVINLFQKLFRDLSLGTEVIPLPYEDKEHEAVDYTIKVQSDESPGYNYEIIVTVTYS